MDACKWSPGTERGMLLIHMRMLISHKCRFCMLVAKEDWLLRSCSSHVMMELCLYAGYMETGHDTKKLRLSVSCGLHNIRFGPH